MEIQNIAVIGAGIMGHGIAQVAATKGYAVWLRDIDDNILRKGIDSIQKSLARQVRAGNIQANEVEDIVARVQTTKDLSQAANEADVVIEAIVENMDLKQQIFSELDKVSKPEAIYASNTSQFSITALASSTSRPDRFCGMHFFNPPVMMNIIEIARGMRTSDDTYNSIVELCHILGKDTVVCKDSQGFITSRLIASFVAEATRILEEGVASPADIDKACRLAFNHRMGPFETTDLTGVDVMLYVTENLREAFGEHFRPSQTLLNLVRAGFLGRKSGRGFYTY